MKKILLLAVFLYFSSLSLSAQGIRYYAIDGSEWLTEKDRDAREEILWDNMELNLNYIKKRKLPQAELAGIYAELMVLYKDLFASVREINMSFKTMIDENGIELELMKPVTKISIVRANNKEILYAKDLKDIYNLALDQYDLVSKHAEDIVNYDLGETDNAPKVDIDRFTKNEIEMAVLGEKVKEVADAMQEVVNNHDKRRQPVIN